MYKNIQ